MMQVLLSLPSRHRAVALELTAARREIGFQLAVERGVASEALGQLSVQTPGLVVAEREDTLLRAWSEPVDSGSLVLEFALAGPWLRPLIAGTRPLSSHLLPLLGTVADLESDEFAVLQLLFQRCQQPWAKQCGVALQPVANSASAAELVKAAESKLQTPLFAVSLRLGLRAASEAAAWRLAQGIYRALEQLSLGAGNALMPLDPGGYGDSARERDLLARQSQRAGMILNAIELASLAALPDGDVVLAGLRQVRGKTRIAPPAVHAGAVRLGVNEHRGSVQEVYLPAALRRRHVHLIGASGTGKSTLMLQMAMQDLEAGRGLALIDPHGDLVDEVLARMPVQRHKDLVLIDPADPAFTVGFNVLHAKTDLERQLLSSDLVATFKRLSTSWGDQMTSVLGNAVLAFLEHPEGGTLADLRRFLVEPAFRKRHVAEVTDEEVRYFWQKEYRLLSGRPQAPLLTRLDTFLRHRLVREMVAQRESTFDLRRIMDERGVLLVRLSQGAIGEENAALLAAFFVSRLQQAAQSRQELAESAREDFTLYLDEFHNYLTPSMAAILSGARKYRLGLVLAHQDLSQLGGVRAACWVRPSPTRRRASAFAWGTETRAASRRASPTSRPRICRVWVWANPSAGCSRRIRTSICGPTPWEWPVTAKCGVSWPPRCLANSTLGPAARCAPPSLAAGPRLLKCVRRPLSQQWRPARSRVRSRKPQRQQLIRPLTILRPLARLKSNRPCRIWPHLRPQPCPRAEAGPATAPFRRSSRTWPSPRAGRHELKGRCLSSLDS